MADWNKPSQTNNDNSGSQWSAFGSTTPASGTKAIEQKLLGFPRTTVLMFFMLVAGLAWVAFAKVKAKTGVNITQLEAARTELLQTSTALVQAINPQNPKQIAFQQALQRIYIPTKDRQLVLNVKVKAPFNMKILKPELYKHESDSASIPKIDKSKYIVEEIIKEGEYFAAKINGKTYRTDSKLNGWIVNNIDLTGVEFMYTHKGKKLFTKLVVAEKPASLENTEVSEILTRGDEFYAIIDGEEKFVNDPVENWRITDISKDRVKVQFGDKVKFLKVNMQAPDITGIKISGILCDEQDPKSSSAWVEGREHKIGHKLRGWTIIQIKPNSIVLKFRNRTEEIMMSDD